MNKYLTYNEGCEVVSFLNENAMLPTIPLNEDAQLSAGSAVVDKMLDLTISRYNKIDFGDIEKSRGDVTNCRMYKNLREAIDILCDIDMTTHKIPGAVVVSTALNNLLTLKNNFMYGFRTKNSLAIILYNTMYYSIVEATSYLIATSVDFVKNGNKVEYTAHEINNRDVVLINNLNKFNQKVADGVVIKFINTAHDTEVEYKANGETLTEASFFSDSLDVIKKILGKFGTIEEKLDQNGKLNKHIKLSTPGKIAIGFASAAALIYLMVNIIPIIKSCIYVIYRLRHKISESAKIQAELIEMNVEILKEQGADEDVITKQEKAAERFRKIADKFALDCDKSERDAKKDTNEDKIDATEVII